MHPLLQEMEATRRFIYFW